LAPFFTVFVPTTTGRLCSEEQGPDFTVMPAADATVAVATVAAASVMSVVVLDGLKRRLQFVLLIVAFGCFGFNNYK
jgi:hypothetical protein